ncbi:MAG: hypothetical protein LAT75_14895, partial [Candidatus Cyclonatronum sp.]|uniref:hypothetical protein n=1 Tax=Cyclonatronum sp. TaxID=3024185 RepID=UPI0025B81F6F
ALDWLRVGVFAVLWAFRSSEAVLFQRLRNKNPRKSGPIRKIRGPSTPRCAQFPSREGCPGERSEQAGCDRTDAGSHPG